VITMQDFLKALDLPHTQDTEQVFHLFDKNGDGQINFREIVESSNVEELLTGFKFAEFLKLGCQDWDN
jgi:Ca2+-binding EF-hand superfamily protein